MSRRILGGAALILAMGVATPALASSYAVSFNQISNFNIDFVSGTGSLMPFTFSNSSAATESGGTGDVDLMDADASCLFCSFDNEFFQHSTTGGAFSYGDAQIVDAGVIPGNGEANAIGEAYTLTGIGYGSGSNSMSATMTVSAGTQVSFGFNADMYMQTLLTAGGQSAYASSSMVVMLETLAGGSVLNWAPVALNTQIFGNDSRTVSNGIFTESTGGLAAGTYRLTIEMAQIANVTAVPVPAAVWLFGSGLLGLVGVARRRAV